MSKKHKSKKARSKKSVGSLKDLPTLFEPEVESESKDEKVEETAPVSLATITAFDPKKLIDDILKKSKA